jgi:quercetin dioxygenase-like cupin family protein
MEVIKATDVTDVKIDKFPYKGKLLDVKGISVRWLSKFGDDGHGYPDYGLRLFTAAPSGEIPIHNHFYHQTMYILSGVFECWKFDPQTDQLEKKLICPAGTSIYIPSMEPHGMRNLSQTEEATFLCCICNVYEEGGAV